MCVFNVSGVDLSEKTFEFETAIEENVQKGTNDCGVFVCVYLHLLCLGRKHEIKNVTQKQVKWGRRQIAIMCLLGTLEPGSRRLAEDEVIMAGLKRLKEDFDAKEECLPINEELLMLEPV